MKCVNNLKGSSMRGIFDRIIARLENISEYDDYGEIVNLDEALSVIYELRDEYSDCIYMSLDDYMKLVEYKYMYEDLRR